VNQFVEPQPQPPREAESQEPRLPGDRSGEGSGELFREIEQDVRRKAGLPPKPRESQQAMH
jgi:hypothetical protein